nr:GNAT family N-acyltransferase [Poseidonocella sp. HB161398]
MRQARAPGDLARAAALRALAFRGDAAGEDRDALDPLCRHFMVEEAATGRLACCFRVLALDSGRAACGGYAAQFYDLAPLAAIRAPVLELGRFCLAPGAGDPDILRLAWAGLAALVAQTGAAMIFGCSSFPGTDPAAHAESFALLAERHLAPAAWRPRCRPDTGRVPLARAAPADPLAGMRAMPPLLRSYLRLGGRVGDHAVADPDLGTLHVFTGLEIAAIPPRRAARLRELAGIALPAPGTGA